MFVFIITLLRLFDMCALYAFKTVPCSDSDKKRSFYTNNFVFLIHSKALKNKRRILFVTGRISYEI